jgi:hypothetical protein
LLCKTRGEELQPISRINEKQGKEKELESKAHSKQLSGRVNESD